MHAKLLLENFMEGLSYQQKDNSEYSCKGVNCIQFPVISSSFI